ncbi:MAG: CbiX/SirB N-terminal domain-containing protein [Pseudomonadota bacterium]|nr:CbiX/SirB N-terminal domain-containing protein [Pseudomonadota bacterium]
MPDRSIILFAHGARDPRWAEPFATIAERMRQQRPAVPIELAFLELMQPDLATAARRLVAAGATRIDVVPLFLGQGGHLRNDLPPLVEALRGAHPDTAFRLHPAIGENAAVIAAIASAAHEAAVGE